MLSGAGVFVGGSFARVEEEVGVLAAAASGVLEFDSLAGVAEAAGARAGVLAAKEGEVESGESFPALKLGGFAALCGPHLRFLPWPNK